MSILNIKCFSCGKTKHISRNCPDIHFIKSKEEVLNKLNLEYKRFCKTFKRNSKSKFHSLSHKEEIKLSVWDFKNFLDYYKKLGLIKNLDLKLVDILNEMEFQEIMDIYAEKKLTSLEDKINKIDKRNLNKLELQSKGERDFFNDNDNLQIDQIKNFTKYYINGNFSQLANSINVKAKFAENQLFENKEKNFKSIISYNNILMSDELEIKENVNISKDKIKMIKLKCKIESEKIFKSKTLKEKNNSIAFNDVNSQLFKY